MSPITGRPRSRPCPCPTDLPGSERRPAQHREGVNRLWIGECFGCGQSFTIKTKSSKIPDHRYGDEDTYQPFK